VEQNRLKQNQSKPRLAFVRPAHQLTIDQHYRGPVAASFIVVIRTQSITIEQSSRSSSFRKKMALLESEYWRLLLRAIRSGQCIVVLGRGAALDPAAPTGDPLPIRLARELAAKLRGKGFGNQIASETDLPHVAQIYASEMPGHPALELAVEDFYKPYLNQTTPLHLDLAALPFSLCLTTTPERFLLNAFSQTAGKFPLSDYYSFRSARVGQQAPPEKDAEKKPLIYDLFGSMEEPTSLVLTENDLLDFLVNVARGQPPLNRYVTSRFSNSGTSFLFIGVGFRQWYLRILLHVLKAFNHEVSSLALEDPNFFKDPEQPQTALFFRKGHRIDFQNLPWLDFVRELRRDFEAQTAALPARNAGLVQLGDDAPIAFLCHENRDKPYAEALGAKLNDRGIAVWLDKQSLRGGDEWPRLIPHVVEKQTNYVVVLQSPRMLDKPESYFFKEMKLALERHDNFGGRRFVVPTIIERDKDLPLRDLAHLHQIDLTVSDGVEQLAKAIHEDWKLRQDMLRRQTTVVTA